MRYLSVWKCAGGSCATPNRISSIRSSVVRSFRPSQQMQRVRLINYNVCWRGFLFCRNPLNYRPAVFAKNRICFTHHINASTLDKLKWFFFTEIFSLINSMNIFVKTIPFDLGWSHRYGVLKMCGYRKLYCEVKHWIFSSKCHKTIISSVSSCTSFCFLSLWLTRRSIDQVTSGAVIMSRSSPAVRLPHINSYFDYRPL